MALVSSPELLMPMTRRESMESTTKPNFAPYFGLNETKSSLFLFVSHDLLAYLGMRSPPCRTYCGQTVESGKVNKRLGHTDRYIPYTKALLR